MRVVISIHMSDVVTRGNTTNRNKERKKEKSSYVALKLLLCKTGELAADCGHKSCNILNSLWLFVRVTANLKPPFPCNGKLISGWIYSERLNTLRARGKGGRGERSNAIFFSFLLLFTEASVTCCPLH